MKRGKFIVIDGIDGSGKTTQTGLLAKRLKKEGYHVMIADFPQHGEKSAALADEYLNGKYGTAEEVGPYRASIFFACDRYAASLKIKKFLDKGGIVISNRYVTANMGHQGGKIKSRKERKKYFAWLYDLEYRIFSIPKPDINIILHLDTKIAQKLVDKKVGKRNERKYILNGKKDIHEMDEKHLRNSEKVYIEISKLFPDFILVECARKGQLMTKEEINGIMWARISNFLSK
jgi:dTMP kinase